MFVAMALALFAVVWFSAAHLDRQPDYPVPPAHFVGSGLLEGWFRFDGGWYDSIARGGYFYAGPNMQSPVAYFPAYPLAMRLVHSLVRDWTLAGILTTLVCGLAVAILFYRWCLLKFDETTARTALVMLLVYPYAWYLFGAVYADALFLASALAAFVLVEKDHTVLAGIAAVVATAARPIGVAVIVGLAAVVLQKRGSLRKLRPGDAGVLLGLGGLFAWMSYLSRNWGDPLLFTEVQGAPGWDQQEGPRTWFKVTFLQRISNLPHWLMDSIHGNVTHGGSCAAMPREGGAACPWTESAYTLGLVLQALLMVAVIALTYLVVKRLGWGYGLYVSGVVLIPLFGSKDFQGVGRYMLAAFPCVAVAAGVLVRHPGWRHGWLVVSGLLLVLLTSAYARGYYVA